MQSLSCNVHEMLRKVVPYCVYVLKVLLLPFTKILSQNYQEQTNFLTLDAKHMTLFFCFFVFEFLIINPSLFLFDFSLVVLMSAYIDTLFSKAEDYQL